MRTSSSLLLSLVLIFFLTACSTSTQDNYLREELANKPMMMLSRDNPYVAANLFLASEMKQSSFLDGFIKFRGTPDAIELKKDYFKALRVYLYYIDKQEAYLLQEHKLDWIIRGPEQIPAQRQMAFSSIIPAGRNAPLAITAQAAYQQSEVNMPRGALDSKAFQPPTEPLPQEVRIPKTRQNAKVSASGDLIHNVTIPGETLRVISRWYTGDADNTERIARINNVPNPNVISMGQTIRIPRYLLSNTRPLPQAEVEAYRKTYSFDEK